MLDISKAFIKFDLVFFEFKDLENGVSSSSFCIDVMDSAENALKTMDRLRNSSKYGVVILYI